MQLRPNKNSPETRLTSLFYLMTFHRNVNKSNSVGVTVGAEMAYPFGEYKINPLFRGVRGTPSFVFRVIFCLAVYAILSFVCW